MKKKQIILYLLTFFIINLNFMLKNVEASTNITNYQNKQLENVIEKTKTIDDMVYGLKFSGRLHFESFYHNNKNDTFSKFPYQEKFKPGSFDIFKMSKVKFSISKDINKNLLIYTSFSKDSDSTIKLEEAYTEFNINNKLFINLGNYYIPLTMESCLSSNKMPITNYVRSLYTFGLFKDKGIGLTISYLEDIYGIKIGIYSKDFNDKNIKEKDLLMFNFRGHYLLYKNKSNLIHLGLNTYYKRQNFTEANSKIQNYNNNIIGMYTFKNITKIGLEFAVNYNMFNFVSEGFFAILDPSKQKEGVVNTNILENTTLFKAYSFYTQLNIILTGETYEYSDGNFENYKIKNQINQGGSGGWDVVLKFALSNFNDKNKYFDLNYGNHYEITAGINWSPIQNVKVLLHYTNIFENFNKNLIKNTNDKVKNNYNTTQLIIRFFF